jgi:hypothetical protein
MRPIRIDSDLNAFAKKFSEDLFKDKRSDFIKPLAGLQELLIKYPHSTNPVQFRILNYIINGINQSLLYLNPTQQQKLVKITDKFFSNIFFYENKATDFSNEIVKALRYDALQESEAFKIAEKIKIKACPYCNAMLTIVVSKENHKKVRFQLDHFFPKSKYPFLCTSFFNLIPCCGNCNQSKSHKNVALGKDFHLYANQTPFDAFKFSLPDADTVKTFIGVTEKNFSFLFTHKMPGNEEFVKNHNKSFAIQSIYETQKDIIEELIWKKQSNYNSKINELKKLLRLDELQIKRMIVGNYTEYKDIHKRPLAKFMQDISHDLELI